MLGKDRDVASILATLKAEFPTLEDFERDFPFQIYYKLGSEQPEYIPDFVAELDGMILMVETKARVDLASAEVQAKSAAASRWCRHASEHVADVGGKSWRYLVVLHDEVSEDKRLSDYLRYEVKDAGEGSPARVQSPGRHRPR